MPTTRKALYAKFGPKLLAATVLLIKDEINILRVDAGKPERTTQQLMDGIVNKMSGLPDGEWLESPT
tara:strand:+ start:584 stop:784 length:201 start_codon:yes stop_codon:yes gene_type:complete